MDIDGKQDYHNGMKGDLKLIHGGIIKSEKFYRESGIQKISIYIYMFKNITDIHLNKFI